MTAEFYLNNGESRLAVVTQPHVVAGNLQQTQIRVSKVGQTGDLYALDQDERKALAAFLLSIPDDQL